MTDKTLAELAAIIRADWKRVHYAAAPYLQALATMHTIDDEAGFGYDGPGQMVAYFLSNAGAWRGPVAREVKAELRRRLAR